MKRFLLSILFFVGLVSLGFGQSTGDFQTRQSGNWNNSDTWEEWTGSSWVNTANTPTNANGVISVLNTHTVTVTVNVTTDQTFVRTGGQITINSGITLSVAAGSGDDLTVESGGSVNNSGTISIQNVAAPPPPRVALIRVYGDLIINANGQINNASTSTLIFESNSRYVHAKNNGSIPTSSWNAASTIEITGVTDAEPTGLAQSFGNFIWNCPSQSAFIDLDGVLTTVNGDFSMLENASFGVYLASTVDYTINVLGDFRVSGSGSYFGFNSSNLATVNVGGAFLIENNSTLDHSFNGNIELNVTGNVLYSNSTINIAYGGSAVVTYNIEGDLSVTSSTIGNQATNNGSINFVGTGTQNVSGAIDFGNFDYVVGSSSDLTIPNGSYLAGSVDFNLNTGGKLVVGSVAAGGAIQTGTTNGNIRVSGTRTYSTGATIEYNGTATQSLGNGFPSSGVNLTISNTGGGVNMSSNVTISSGRTLTLTAGTFNIGDGNLLTLNGTVSTTSGGLSGGALSNLTIGGTGAFGTLGFVGTNELGDFTINRTSSGSVTLGGDLVVNGVLTQTEGDLLLNGNALTISGDYTQSVGTLISNSTSSLLINGTGSLPAALSISGDINSLTLNRSSTTLNTAVSSFTATNLNLFSGTLDGTAISIADGGTVERRTSGALSNALTAVGSYNLIYDHSIALNTGAELSTSATALNNIEKRGNGILTVQNDFTANGSLTFTTGSFDAGANTISLNGDLIANAASTLSNSTISFDGTTNLTGSNNPIFGSITVNGIFNPAASLTVNGDITNNGTLNSSAGTLTINATSQLGGSNPINVNNFTIGASGVVTASAAQALEIDGNFTNNGSFAANGGTVIFGGNTTISGTVPDFASIQVDGIFNAPSPLNLSGGLTNNGTFNDGNGIINMTGGSVRAIAGTGAFNIHTLNLDGSTVSNNNTGGVSIENGITLAANTIFDADGGGSGITTLLSTSSTDAAYVGQIPSTSSVTGNITVQRFFSTGRFWRYLGSPVTNATIADWQQEFAITGSFSDPSSGTFDGTPLNSSTTSLYYYDASGSAYVAYPTSGTAASNPIENGRGYSPFVRNSSGTVVGAVTGTLRQQAATLPVAFNGVPADSWNLVANPYAAPIDWDAAGWTKTNVANEVHVPKTDGSFATYIGGVAGNGGSQYIASGQAFWVRTSAGSPSLQTTESVKSVGQNPTYQRTEPLELFRIKMLHAGLSDEIVFALRDEATFGYDEAFDANRRLNINGFGYTLSTTGDDDRKLKINSIPKVVDSDCSISIPINMESVTKTGDFTLSFSEISTLLQYYDVDFIDNYENDVISIDADFQYNYVINADAGSKSTTRFSLQLNNTDISPLSGLENIDACANTELTYSLGNLNQHYIYSIYKGEELLTELSNQTNAAVAIPDTFVQSALNEFDVYARAGTCDSVLVGAFAISIADNTINLNVNIIGSNICPTATAGNFELSTEEGVKYSIINGTDTIQNIVGDGTIFTGIVESTYLNAGVNSFNVYAEKNRCTYGTLAQSIEIFVDDVEIDESIAFTSPNTCLKSPSDIIFTSQSGVDYQIFKGTTLVKTITGDGSEQTVEIAAGNLSLGTNEFTIMAQYGQCAEFEFPEPIQIEVEENINTNLSLITENICGDSNTSVLIENAQAGKVYTLQSATENISSLTAQADGELVFNLNPNQLNIGLNEFDIQIEGEFCGQIASTNKAQITMFEPIDTNLDYTTNSSCSEAEVLVGIQNAQANKTYYLYKGETLIETVAATEAGSIVFETANNSLDVGGNEFRVEIEGEGCGIETALQTINVNLFEGINSALEITSNDVCYGQDIVVEIANPQINKTYVLKTTEGVITSRLAESTGALSFAISSEQFAVGNRDILVEISDENCGTVEANSTSFTVYESINSNLSYLSASANSCSSNEAVVGIENAQAGKIYKLYKGGSLVESITASEDGELIFANANNELVEGLNTFNLTIEGEACGLVEAEQNLSTTLYESINPDLEINSSNVCTGNQVNIEIANPQVGKTYRLMASENIMATETAANEDVLIFSLPSSNFGIGYHVLNIDIMDDNCGTLAANQTVEFELFDAAVITEIEDQNVCKGESVTIDLSANLTMSSYQLYLGEELVSEVSTGTLNLSPTETTTYTLTGIPENGCSVNTVNFTIEVSELATPGILVSANVLESSVEGDSYQWYLNEEILEGETAKILVAQESGDYKVEVSKANCLKISDSYTFSEEVLDANKALADAVHLYPNPVVDVLRIDMENINEVEVKIYTLSGRFMDKINLNSDSEQAVDMSKFANGTYLIQITSGKGSITKRIIKK